jgi:hypothetical protein
MKAGKPKVEADVNEKSFFATTESVGAYWSGVESGRKRHARIKGTGAIQKSKPPQGIVVVNPSRMKS